MKQTSAAASNSTGVPPLEQLPEEDQALLRELSAKIKRGDATSPEGQNAKEEAFHEAVSELHTYIFALRAQLDVGFTEPDLSDTGNSWAKAEPTRPSVKRVQYVAYNFLDFPGVRKSSLSIHMQKLVAALPHFREGIAGSIPPCDDLSDHFSQVTTFMADIILASLDPEKLDQYRKLGMIMGFRTAGMRWPIGPALRHFAGQGVETFVVQLERVVRGALEDGVDPLERVRAEILEREGTIYRLMRVSFDRVNDAVGDIKGRGIEDARRILAENDYSTGGCPAVLSIDSLVEAEPGAKRPIAYEYGIPIVSHIPPRLLQPQ